MVLSQIAQAVFSRSAGVRAGNFSPAAGFIGKTLYDAYRRRGHDDFFHGGFQSGVHVSSLARHSRRRPFLAPSFARRKPRALFAVSPRRRLTRARALRKTRRKFVRRRVRRFPRRRRQVFRRRRRRF